MAWVSESNAKLYPTHPLRAGGDIITLSNVN